MKKLLWLLLVLNLMLVLIGCSSKETVKSEEERKAEIRKEIGVEEKGKEEVTNKEDTNKDEEKTDNEAKGVNEKLKDFESIKEYLLNDDYFGMGYYEAQGENFNYDNYKLHHLDFTGDDELDTVIVTFTNEDDYRPVVFVTLENGKYKHYFTDLRATKDSNFYYEDGFIIEEHNGYHQLAFNASLGDVNYIKRTKGSFYNETIESDYILNPDMKSKVINTVNKIDGYNVFETDYMYYFYDETGKEHLISHYKYHYNFNEDNAEYEYKEEIVVDNNLDQIMSDNFIAGSDNSLKTFEQVIAGSDSLKNAIDYYLENRQKFERNNRIKYIDDLLNYVNEFTFNFTTIVDEEVVSEASITKVTLWGENPIPTNAQDIFKIVRYFYIADGENMDYDIKLEDGEYYITCVDEAYSNKIRMMKFDRAVLRGEDTGYISRQDEYVDLVFDTKENVYERADEIVYPTILIKNLSQLNDLKHKSIWKTNVVIIPENIEFLEFVNEEEIEIKGDEIITTYAYKNLDGIDVSTLEEVVINGKEATKDNPEYAKLTGDEYEYKVAFFGEVKNVKINYSSYIYESYGVEIGTYDSLKDTLLIIKSNKMNFETGFFVIFEDERGVEGRFIVNDTYVHDEDPVELKSGFTALEKTPSPYADYNMSDLIKCIGMTMDEFESSDMMKYAEKVLEPGMDEAYYVYYVNDLIKGVNIRFNSSVSDNIITRCLINKDQEAYEKIFNDEKYSFLGMDFDMSLVRAKYNMIKPDALIEMKVWGEDESPDSICDSLVIYK